MDFKLETLITSNAGEDAIETFQNIKMFLK
jgi:hypothetical protein